MGVYGTIMGSSSSSAAAAAAAGAVVHTVEVQGANGKAKRNYRHGALAQHAGRAGVGIRAHLGMYVGQILLAAWR